MSARTGVKIVTGCGWYTEPFYPPGDDLARRSVGDIADELIGRDPGRLRRHRRAPGDHRRDRREPGLGVAAGGARAPRRRARAQIATGLPLATHTLYHSTGAAQMALFDEEGVDPARVCVGHCDTFPSLDYCLGVARWGGYVSIDNLGHAAGEHEAQVRRVVLGLLEAGFAGQVLLSQDVGQVPELRSRGGRGYTYIDETFLPGLRAVGVDDATIRAMTRREPAALVDHHGALSSSSSRRSWRIFSWPSRAVQPRSVSATNSRAMA